MRTRLLQLLNIRSDEAWLVGNLFWMRFFSGISIAIFYITAVTLFLEHFQVTMLPKVYIFSAILLLITGYIYSKAEHSISVKGLVLGVTFFVGISILLFRAQFYFTGWKWMIFLMLAWYEVIYLLNNLEFWGTAALLFDIRQSKRLFGMIGAGDLAKLVGYSVVPALIKLTSSQDLLTLSAAFMFLSLIFYFRLKRKGHLDLSVKYDLSRHNLRPKPETVTGFVKGFFVNRMIGMVAGMSFIVITCVTVMTFAFYAEVKHQMHSDEQLTYFISLFYASGGILAILIRLILTGRLTTVLGTKGSLLISPLILMVVLLGIIFIFPFINDSGQFILYTFGLMMIITNVLKTAVQDPVFLSLMQPLPSFLRLKSHTIVKGVMDPFALAFSGFMLFGIITISGKVDLYLFSYLLLVLVIIWVVTIFIVDREYIRTLVSALNKRYSVGQEINLADEKTRKVLETKISEGETGEAIYILNLVEKQFSEEHEGLVVKAIAHGHKEVRMAAIRLAERKKVMAALPQIEEIIRLRTDLDILPEAVKAKCMLLPDELQDFDVFVEDKDHRLMKAAITGLMTSGGITAVVTAGQKLLQIIASDSAAERKMAAEIIGDLQVQSFYQPLIQLLQDKDPGVAIAAITAAGKVRNDKLMAPLMEIFMEGRYEKLALDALRQAGGVALREVKNALLHEKLSRQKKSKLILLCGRIGTQEAMGILDELVWKLPTWRSEIFHALHLCEFRSHPGNRLQHMELMNQYSRSAIRIVFMMRQLEQVETAKLMSSALQLELNEIRDSMLLLFSFLYNKEKMVKAKNAFQMNKKENIANALEVIEIEVPKEISLKFAKIFEPGSLGDKCSQLSVFFTETLTYETIMDDIINDRHHYYHRWTRATALYSAIFYQGPQKIKWLTRGENDNDPLLKEIGDRAMSELNTAAG